MTTSLVTCLSSLAATAFAVAAAELIDEALEWDVEDGARDCVLNEGALLDMMEYSRICAETLL